MLSRFAWIDDGGRFVDVRVTRGMICSWKIVERQFAILVNQVETRTVGNLQTSVGGGQLGFIVLVLKGTYQQFGSVPNHRVFVNVPSKLLHRTMQRSSPLKYESLLFKDEQLKEFRRLLDLGVSHIHPPFALGQFSTKSKNLPWNVVLSRAVKDSYERQCLPRAFR